MSILEALSPYKILFEIVVIGSLAGGAVWAAHEFLEHERAIGRAEVQARWDEQVAKDNETARLETVRLEKQAEDAEKNGATREQTIRTLAAAAGSANLSLHDTLAAIRGSVPNATIDSLGKSVATLSTVLADCSGRYQGMAEIADRHASDVKTLSEAWPKKPSVAK
jgi:hypothetical protein